MDFLILFILIIIILYLINFKGSLEEKVTELTKKLDLLKKEITTLKSGEIKLGDKVIPNVNTQQVKKVEPKEEIALEPIRKDAPLPKVEPKEIVTPKIKTNLPPVVKPPQPSFLERYPDLEKFIGENLINKIGIAILVLGIGFFVKYAIDKDWINEIGRVFIGIICGGILLAFAHKLRKTFKPFSSVLVGGGLAIFYFTIAIAFHQYQIFSQTTAFIIMVIITGFSVLLSIAYDRKELAVLAIIGGFASPFMVSTGEGNYIVLFSYILILNAGMLVLAYFKKWNIINIISYVFTIILYGGWLTKTFNGEKEVPYIGALVFGTLFYLVFFFMNVVNNIKEKTSFVAQEILILISNTFLYYSAGMVILAHLHSGLYQGLFTALIAVFNFIFAFTLFKSKKADSNLVYLLIGLVLTFISLAAPVQLEGNHITLFWSAEAVLLLWLSQKSGIRLMKVASVIVTGLMMISLLLDWVNVYEKEESLNIVLNKGFITSFISIISIALTIKLLSKEDEIFLIEIKKQFYSNLLSFALVIILYISILLELSYHLNVFYPFHSFRTIVIASYNYLFIVGLFFYSRKKDTRTLTIGTTIIGIIALLSYFFYYHFKIIEVRNLFIKEQQLTLGNFLYHYLDSILLFIIIGFGLINIKKLFGLKSYIGKAYLWFMSFAIIFILSIELDTLVLWFSFKPKLTSYDIINQSHKIGYPILWGICSFILMTLGMSKKLKELRIISLSVFLIILLKLFLIDFREMSEGGRIASFICLGIILLVISFMYQKLKKLVIEDTPKTFPLP